MEQHESDLIRDLIKANREDVIGRIDAQGRDIADIKTTVTKLQEEYDAVLVEMKATRKIIKLAGGIVSMSGGIATFLYYLAILHII